jgi:hypothetical protein
VLAGRGRIVAEFERATMDEGPILAAAFADEEVSLPERRGRETVARTVNRPALERLRRPILLLLLISSGSPVADEPSLRRRSTS